MRIVGGSCPHARRAFMGRTWENEGPSRSRAVPRYFERGFWVGENLLVILTHASTDRPSEHCCQAAAFRKILSATWRLSFVSVA